jgi:glycine cleavage system transcriptional repressor
MPERIELVITVMSRDRVGIVAGVTAAIAARKGNVSAMSQTVMRGYFTIIITAGFPAGVSPEAVRAEVAAAGEPGELAVAVTAWEPAAVSEPVVKDSDVFVLSIIGPDQPGIIAKISRFLQSRNINIIDLYAYADDGHLIFISQVMVARSLDVGQLKIDLVRMIKKQDMVIHFQHENIFIATNKIEFRPGR